MDDVKIIDHTKEMLDAKDKAIEKALEMIGGEMERYAVLDCPVDTGLLRNSIVFCVDGGFPSKKKYSSDSGGESGGYDGEMPKEPEGKRAVIVGTNVEYAPYQELGTSKIPGKHFLRNSVQNHISEYNKMLSDEIKEAIK